MFKRKSSIPEFSVVANNCWGAEIYRELRRPYATPFVGLFLFPGCYLRLLSDLRSSLETPLEFVAESRYESANASRERRAYPIGLLGDIEIHFLHYAGEAVAREKWTRRLARMVWDPHRMFFKFCDRDGCTEQQLVEFDRLDFPNKVCFTAQPHPELRSTVWIESARGDACVTDGAALYDVCKPYFNARRWVEQSVEDAARAQAT